MLRQLFKLLVRQIVWVYLIFILQSAESLQYFQQQKHSNDQILHRLLAHNKTCAHVQIVKYCRFYWYGMIILQVSWKLILNLLFLSLTLFFYSHSLHSNGTQFIKEIRASIHFKFHCNTRCVRIIPSSERIRSWITQICWCDRNLIIFSLVRCNGCSKLCQLRDDKPSAFVFNVKIVLFSYSFCVDFILALCWFHSRLMCFTSSKIV